MLYRFLLVAVSWGLTTGVHATLLTYDFGDEDTGGLMGSGDDTYYRSSLYDLTLIGEGFKGVDLNDPGDDVSDSFADTEAVKVDTGGGSRGLSVDSGGDDEDNRIDGDGPDEAILFSLGRAGTITEILFDNFGGNDDFNLVVDGIVQLVDIDDLIDDRWVGEFSFVNSFAIGADGLNDEFRVRSLALSVPEPSAFSLLAFGFGAVLLVRRRHRVKD